MNNKKILILQNISHEKPGLIQQILQEHKIDFDIIDVSQNLQWPNIIQYQGLIVLGGPDSANATNLKITQELQYIQSALQNNIPYLGICLGLQLLVKATGGQVIPASIPEHGLGSVQLTPEAHNDLVCNNLPEQFPVFQLHNDTILPAKNITLLATGQDCTYQIIRVGNTAYGTQFHFELTKGMLQVWIQKDPDLMKLDSTTLQKDFQTMYESYTTIGKTLIQNWLQK